MQDLLQAEDGRNIQICQQARLRLLYDRDVDIQPQECELDK